MSGCRFTNETDAVRAVLRQWRGEASSSWRVTPMARGGQASVFRVAAAHGAPLLPGVSEAIVKLYRVIPANFDVATEEEAALGQLHAAVDGREIAGWRLVAPRPLFRCVAPVALVSTRAPGRPLAVELRDGSPEVAAELDSVAAALLGGLQAFWAPRTRVYGDLSLDNVLVDVEHRTLSFVDPGVDEPDTWFAHVPRRCYPASRDLGYALFNAAASLRAHWRSPLAWRRRIRLSQVLLHLHLANLPHHERRHLIDEAHATCRVLLRRINTAEASPRGLWRRVVRTVATLTIQRALLRLRSTEPHIGRPRRFEGGLA